MSNELEVNKTELDTLDKLSKNIMAYSEDDRRKADDLFQYYQELIQGGDNKGETRQALAKALELRETSVNNLVEILKLKTKLIDRKLQFEMKQMDSNSAGDNKGRDTSDIIASMEEYNET